MSKRTKAALEKLIEKQAPLREELAPKVDAGDTEALAELHQLDKALLEAKAADGDTEAKEMLDAVLLAEEEALKDAEKGSGADNDAAATTEGEGSATGEQTDADKAAAGDETKKEGEQDDKDKQDASNDDDADADAAVEKGPEFSIEIPEVEEGGKPSAKVVVEPIESYNSIFAQIGKGQTMQGGPIQRRYFSAVKSICTCEYNVPRKTLVQLVLDQAHKGSAYAFTPKNRTLYSAYMGLTREERRGFSTLMSMIADLADPATRQARVKSIDWEVLRSNLPGDEGEAIVAAFMEAVNA